MPIQDGIQSASEFQLDALTIVSASGAAVDLREIMRELNLFEDLFSNTMTGDLFLADTQNLINLLPIVGVEHLIVTKKIRIKGCNSAKITSAKRITLV